jgi:hypothetical protein
VDVDGLWECVDQSPLSAFGTGREVREDHLEGFYPLDESW